MTEEENKSVPNKDFFIDYDNSKPNIIVRLHDKFYEATGICCVYGKTGDIFLKNIPEENINNTPAIAIDFQDVINAQNIAKKASIAAANELKNHIYYTDQFIDMIALIIEDHIMNFMGYKDKND